MLANCEIQRILVVQKFFLKLFNLFSHIEAHYVKRGHGATVTYSTYYIDADGQKIQSPTT